jgi:hypothetical protein
MKTLTKIYSPERLHENEFLDFEKHFSVKLTPEIRDFISDYHGSKVKEILFVDSKQELWVLNSFFSFREAIDLAGEFSKTYNRKLMPFAYDPGGWHFCISLEEGEYNVVYINRWTDHLPEEQFLKIANSLEEFIDSLQPEQ